MVEPCIRGVFGVPGVWCIVRGFYRRCIGLGWAFKLHKSVVVVLFVFVWLGLHDISDSSRSESCALPLCLYRAPAK